MYTTKKEQKEDQTARSAKSGQAKKQRQKEKLEEERQDKARMDAVLTQSEEASRSVVDLIRVMAPQSRVPVRPRLLISFRFVPLTGSVQGPPIRVPLKKFLAEDWADCAEHLSTFTNLGYKYALDLKPICTDVESIQRKFGLKEGEAARLKASVDALQP